MVPCWETHPDSDTQPRLLSAVPSSILFRDSPSLPREKVIAAEKAEHSVEAAITLWRSHTHKLDKWRLEITEEYCFLEFQENLAHAQTVDTRPSK